MSGIPETESRILRENQTEWFWGVFDMERKRNVLWNLFVSTLYLSAFTFGGGYVIVSLLKKKFVDEYHWIEEEEMLDLVAIAQSAPAWPERLSRFWGRLFRHF